MELLFVYNADSDRFSKLLDGIHKVVSPATYNCALCALTHGNFGEREEWRSFRKDSNLQCSFLYRDSFQEQHPELFEKYPSLPLIFQKKGGHLTLLLSAEEIRGLSDARALIAAINRRLAKH